MRYIADLPQPAEYCRAMIHDLPEGTYLFVFKQQADVGGDGDLWFEDLASAQESARAQWGVPASDWIEIPDPLPGCQQDIIRPVRIPGRETGDPQWGKLEILQEGKWVPFDPARESA